MVENQQQIKNLLNRIKNRILVVWTFQVKAITEIVGNVGG